MISETKVKKNKKIFLYLSILNFSAIIIFLVMYKSSLKEIDYEKIKSCLKETDIFIVEPLKGPLSVTKDIEKATYILRKDKILFIRDNNLCE